MVAENILKFMSLSVDGRGYAGKVTEYNPPALTLVTEDFRAGGMDAPIDIEMGMEKLTDSFVLISYDPRLMSLWGIKNGGEFQHTVRGSLEDPDGSTRSVIHQATGRLLSVASGTWGSGRVPSLTINRTLTYYRCVHDGVTVHEIDVPNMIRTIDGVDQLAAHRDNIGL